MRGARNGLGLPHQPLSSCAGSRTPGLVVGRLPPLASLVAVEVWLDPDGSVRIVPPRGIARLVDAPIGQNAG
jgi:hypothetical protein